MCLENSERILRQLWRWNLPYCIQLGTHFCMYGLVLTQRPQSKILSPKKRFLFFFFSPPLIGQVSINCLRVVLFASFAFFLSLPSFQFPFLQTDLDWQAHSKSPSGCICVTHPFVPQQWNYINRTDIIFVQYLLRLFLNVQFQNLSPANQSFQV